MFEFLLIILFGAFCFFIGRASMLRTIINMVVDEAQAETATVSKDEPEKLFVEKVNDVYYAYVGQKFAGQSADLNELFSNMKTIYKINTFKITHIEGITKEDSQKIAEAIAKTYNIK